MKSSENSCSSLNIELRPARWLTGYLSVLSGCMLLAAALSGLGFAARLGIYVLVLAWAAWVWRWRSAGIQTLVWLGQGGWRLQDGTGRWRTAHLIGAWSAGPVLNVLMWRDESRRLMALLLTPGMAGETARRRLACHLRWRSVANW